MGGILEDGACRPALSHRQWLRRLKGRWPTWRRRGVMVFAAPVIYAMIVPLAVFDLAVECYQRIIFPVLGVPLVRRRRYMRFDRHRLEYLNPIQKVGCLYCGYANGLLQLAARIAARTEAVFCPIRHQPRQGFQPPPHHGEFAAFGDRAGFIRLWKKWRPHLRDE